MPFSATCTGNDSNRYPLRIYHPIHLPSNAPNTVNQPEALRWNTSASAKALLLPPLLDALADALRPAAAADAAALNRCSTLLTR